MESETVQNEDLNIEQKKEIKNRDISLSFETDDKDKKKIKIEIDTDGNFMNNALGYMKDHIIPGFMCASSFLMNSMRSGQTQMTNTISNENTNIIPTTNAVNSTNAAPFTKMEILLGTYSLFITSLYVSNLLKNKKEHLEYVKYGAIIIVTLGISKFYFN
jgi:hypothetical protein